MLLYLLLTVLHHNQEVARLAAAEALREVKQLLVQPPRHLLPPLQALNRT